MLRVNFLIGWPFKDIFNWIMKLWYELYFAVIKVIAIVLDMLTQLFFIFSGMTPINTPKVDVETGVDDAGVDIVNFFLTQDKFTGAYLSLCGVALILIVVFTIAKIIKQDYFERSGPRSKGPIFRNVALSFIAFICIIPIFFFLIKAAGALALLVMKAMGYGGGGIGTLVFNLSWTDGGDHFRSEVLSKSANYIYDRNMFSGPADAFYKYYWNPSSAEAKDKEHLETFHWWLYIFLGLALIKSIGQMLLAMVSRLYKLIALFIVAPAPISQIVLDDGAKFKGWKDQVIQEALKVVGCVMSFMLFILIASAIPDMDLMKFAFEAESASAKNIIDSNTLTEGLSNDISLLYYEYEGSFVDSTMNSLGKAMILLAGAGAVQDIDSVVTKHISGGSSSMDMGAAGKSVAGAASAAAQGALALGKKAITGTVALAGATVKGVQGIGSAIGDAANKTSARKIEGANNLLKQEEKAASATPTGGGTGGPGGAATPTEGGSVTPEEASTPTNGGTGGPEGANTPTDGESGGPEGANTPTDGESGGPEGASTPTDGESGGPEGASTPTEGNAKTPDNSSAADGEEDLSGVEKAKKDVKDAKGKVKDAKGKVKDAVEDTLPFSKDRRAAKKELKAAKKELDKAKAIKNAQKIVDKQNRKALKKNTSKFGRTMKGIGTWTAASAKILGNVARPVGSLAKTGLGAAGIMAKTMAKMAGFGGAADAIENTIKGTVEDIGKTVSGTAKSVAAKHKNSKDIKENKLKAAQGLADTVNAQEEKTKQAQAEKAKQEQEAKVKQEQEAKAKQAREAKASQEAAEQREYQESAQGVNETVGASLDTVDSSQDSYNVAVALGNDSVETKELSTAEYDNAKAEYNSSVSELETARSNYDNSEKEINEARDQAYNAQNKFLELNKEGSGASKEAIDEAEKEWTVANQNLTDKILAQTDAKNKLDSAVVNSNSKKEALAEVRAKPRTAATRHKIAVENFNNSYNDLKKAKASGDAAKIKTATDNFHNARQELMSAQERVVEVQLEVDTQNNMIKHSTVTSGVAARETEIGNVNYQPNTRNSNASAPQETVVVTVSNSGQKGVSVAGAARVDRTPRAAGESIYKAAAQSRRSDVTKKIQILNNRGLINDGLGVLAQATFGDTNRYYSDRENVSREDAMTEYMNQFNEQELRLDLLSEEELQQALSDISSVPKDSQVDLKSYRGDLENKYKASADAYASAMDRAKESMNAYKNSGNTNDLDKVKQAIAEAITHSVEFNNIKIKIKKDKK